MDELERAQSSLGRALGRARAGEDKELAQKVREGGEQLAHALTGLLKLTRVHNPDNRAFDAPVAELVRNLGTLVDLLGTVHVVTVEDQVYVNDIRIRVDAKPGATGLGGELRPHNVGGLSFHAPLTGPQVRLLIKGLSSPPAPEQPRGTLVAWLEANGVGAVEPSGIYKFRMARADDQPSARRPEEVLALMLELVSQSFTNLAAGRVLNPLPLRRVVVEALESGIDAPAYWVGFPEASPHASHSVEVAMVALLLGRAAGLSTGLQQDLGIAGLLHDAGYLAPGVGEGAAAMQRHPVEGARLVLRQRGFSEAKVRRLRAVLEHHRDFADAAGGPPSTSGAILRLAEDYANVVRLYGAKVTRSDALGAMLKAGGRFYQPALAQLLVNALGRHPPGTLVELTDGRFARVAMPARDRERWDRPVVKVIDLKTRQVSGEAIDTATGVGIRRVLPG